VQASWLVVEALQAPEHDHRIWPKSAMSPCLSTTFNSGATAMLEN
jgi:hypothetical protein